MSIVYLLPLLKSIQNYNRKPQKILTAETRWLWISSRILTRAVEKYVHAKVIIEKSRGEVSPMGQDTIENVS